jgi:ectoine hydroxylase-related dioxygenase (phytanoyl-CoA dioxygenase family)
MVSRHLAPEDRGDAVRQIADLGLFGPLFAELIAYQPLLDVLETLFASPEFSLILMVGRPKAARVGNGISNGAFHRDTPFGDFTAADTITALLSLDDMTGIKGATSFIRGSHQVSDGEAAKPCWREVPPDRLNLREKVDVRCPAGSGIFFTDKVLHAAGHNRSEQPRRTILMEWAGPDTLPTSPERYSYQGLRPRKPLAGKPLFVHLEQLRQYLSGCKAPWLVNLPQDFQVIGQRCSPPGRSHRATSPTPDGLDPWPATGHDGTIAGPSPV